MWKSKVNYRTETVLQIVLIQKLHTQQIYRKWNVSTTCMSYTLCFFPPWQCKCNQSSLFSQEVVVTLMTKALIQLSELRIALLYHVKVLFHFLHCQLKNNADDFFQTAAETCAYNHVCMHYSNKCNIKETTVVTFYHQNQWKWNNNWSEMLFSPNETVVADTMD